MKAILKDELVIDRPIVFLCGPYYDGKNDSDRRALLRKYLLEDLGGNVLPLIIDDFLSTENLKGFQLKLPLLEEILARISRKTLIFLDTISAASEMGLFMNHAFKNKSLVLLPKESDIVENHVGIFAQNVINHNDNAERIYYRPSITLSTAATGYTSEYYGFINDIIPHNIAEYLKCDHELQGYNEAWEIEIDYKKSPVEISLPTRQLFYIVVSIVYDKYLKLLHSPGICDDTLFNCDEIIELVNSAIVNYLIDNKGEDVPGDLKIKTEFDEPLNSIVYHMVSFVFIFHKRSSSRGYQFVSELKNRSVIYFNGRNPREVFRIDPEEFELLRESKDYPEKYFVRKRFSINGKKRELVKYSVEENGERIRTVHKKILHNLNNEYKQHELSFAYKAGTSIKKCTEMHINSCDYIKYDISKFFNSIDLRLLILLFMQEFQIDKRYLALTKAYLECFFVYGKLPLGLVLSPLLSDIYMKSFDNTLEEKCKPYGWVYTRYADDLLISSCELINNDDEEGIEKTIIDLLSEKKLKLNAKKKQHVALDYEGKFIKYIGIFIIKGSHGNYLSVGRSYINQVAKEILDYNDDRAMCPNDKPIETNSKSIYKRQMIIGKIGFLKTIEGERGIRRLATRLKSHMLIESNRFVE